MSQQSARYVVIMDVVQFAFSVLLTSFAVTFCAFKLATATDDASVGIYFPPMLALVMLWAPIKNIKSKMAKRLAENNVAPAVL